ncbi:MAG: hypothetical protein Q9191_003048 [Dirinaria sp. TL-2023a]
MDNKNALPLNIESITIGDGTIGNAATQSDVVVSTWLRQQAKILDIPQDILNAFDNADKQLNESVSSLCYGGSGCATFSTAANYLQQKQPCFSVYNIGYNCQNAPDLKGFAEWLKLPATRGAIHAPYKTYEV